MPCATHDGPLRDSNASIEIGVEVGFAVAAASMFFHDVAYRSSHRLEETCMFNLLTVNVRVLSGSSLEWKHGVLIGRTFESEPRYDVRVADGGYLSDVSDAFIESEVSFATLHRSDAFQRSAA